MSSQLEDDTKYVKLLLLLLKGGTYVFKKHIQKILDSENTTIDICLKTHRDQLFNAFKGKVINRKLWELLDPDSEQPKDVDVWDISSLAYVLLNIFDARLNVGEKVAINKLRDKRNELVHRGDSSLQEEDFLREWSRLTMVLYQLSTGLSSNDQDFVNKLIEDISAIKHPDKAIDDLKLFRMEDDLVKDVLAKQQGIYERRTGLEELIQSICELEIRSKEIDKSANTRPPGLDELTQHICALEEIKGNPKRESDEWSHILGALKEIKRIVKSGQLESDERSHIVGAYKDFKQIVESGPLGGFPEFDKLSQYMCALEEIKRNPESGPLEISARITVRSSTQTARDAAHHKLLEAAKRCLTGGHVSQEEDEVFTACNNMFTDMSEDGASINKVEEGSVVITFFCSTYTSLKRAFLYLTETVYSRRHQELEQALSQSVSCCVVLDMNINPESLNSTVNKEENNFALRYQYLLTVVARSVLRKVFDHIVGPDLKVYLDNNPDRQSDFDKLLSSRNTPSQQLQLLPPIANTPSSDQFDIRLLFCLLRHVCGLCPPSDQVWLNPEPTDNRVEAHITRVRHFINELVDNRSMLESVTLLTPKWNKLGEILQELAIYSRFGNLQEKISNAGSIQVDDQLKETIEDALNDWKRERYEILQRWCSYYGFNNLQDKSNLSEDQLRQEYENLLKELENRIKKSEEQININQAILINYQQLQQKFENAIKERQREKEERNEEIFDLQVEMSDLK